MSAAGVFPQRVHLPVFECSWSSSLSASAQVEFLPQFPRELPFEFFELISRFSVHRRCRLATEPCGRGEVVFNEGSTRDTDQPGRSAREPSDHAGGTRGAVAKRDDARSGKS